LTRSSDFTVAPAQAYLCQRAAYVNAIGAGKGVTEHKPRDQAAQEICALWGFLNTLDPLVVEKKGRVMSDKSKTLLEQFQAVAGKNTAPPGIIAGSDDRPPSRQGKRAVTIWVDPVVAEQLKEIAFTDKKRQQELYLEALNILFSKYGRHEIA
jgi:hypothetical protein